MRRPLRSGLHHDCRELALGRHLRRRDVAYGGPHITGDQRLRICQPIGISRPPAEVAAGSRANRSTSKICALSSHRSLPLRPKTVPSSPPPESHCHRPRTGAKPAVGCTCRGGHAWSIALEDGRWLVMRAPRRRRPRHPASRAHRVLGHDRLRRRPRRLSNRAPPHAAGSNGLEVPALSRSDPAIWQTRVPVEGRDEIAGLAENFNRAAERIEAPRRAPTRCCSPTHLTSLRTPLAPIRLGLELQKDKAGSRNAKPDLKRDIGRTGYPHRRNSSYRADLIRSTTLDVDEDVDLLGLAAEECARAMKTASSTAKPVTVRGDPRLLAPHDPQSLWKMQSRNGRPPIEVQLDHYQGSQASIAAGQRSR